jgi:hypothetical protein
MKETTAYIRDWCRARAAVGQAGMLAGDRGCGFALARNIKNGELSIIHD